MLWSFYLVEQGQCKSPHFEVSTNKKFLDINIEKAEVDKNHILLRASQHGKPIYTEQTINGITHKVIDVEGKQYIPE